MKDTNLVRFYCLHRTRYITNNWWKMCDKMLAGIRSASTFHWQQVSVKRHDGCAIHWST